ncbi:uncharacterized protein [Argopecten irradians]|uniref:uncharacterized protein n=1 Tax=Argopecten irradians TaxID=31199 RepID=UPI0037189E70
MDRGRMYTIQNVAELDEWATCNELSTDTELSLRRLALLTDNRTAPSSINKSDENKCNICDKCFKQKSHLLRHKRTFHGDSIKYTCSHCRVSFNRKDNFERHVKHHKENIPVIQDQTSEASAARNEDGDIPVLKERKIVNEVIVSETNTKNKCNWCMKHKDLLPGKKFCQQCGEQGRECKWCHRPLPEQNGDRTDVCERCVKRRDSWKTRNQQDAGISALDGTAQTETLEPNPGNLWDVLQFFSDNQILIKDILEERLQNVKGMKWFITLFIKFVKYDQNNEAIHAEPTFRSVNLTCTNVSQLKAQLAEAFHNLHNAYQNFERDGSGWTIDKILKLEVNTVEYTPLEGSSYIPLPSNIQKKKAVLNIQNTDQKCFLWSVLASIHHFPFENHPDRVSNYIQYESELNIDGIEFPLPLSQVSKFEKQNDISINVFGLEGGEIYPLHVTDLRSTKHVNLLLFSKGESRHYCLIRNLSRLLGDRTAHKCKTFYCNYCLHGYTTQQLLVDHVPYCSPHGPQKLSFPKKEEQQWVKFNQIHKQLKVPFVIYADFESFVRPISTCEPDPKTSSTTRYQKHEPSGFSYMVKCSSDELSKPAQVYRGPDVVDNFFKQLIQEEETICDILQNVKPMRLTQYEESSFQHATTCHICQKELGDDRVRDHDHLNGSFRGASHSNCNFQFQFRQGKRSQGSKFYIPVIFHNLRGYDMHLLMESAGKFKSKPLSCIPNNMEKYMSFSLGNLRFIDSLQFLNASLDTLVSNLTVDGMGKFSNLSKHFPDEQHLELLLRKGVYPYDYATSPEKFDEKTLPGKDKFYNKLAESDLSDTDYKHAQSVWQTFDMTCFGEYHDLYLKTDVLLLADVFENFRSISLDYYHLDPAHYYTAPGFSWEAMLKMTGVELQLLDDIDMVLMVEKGVRGGVSMISKKFAQANNPKAPGYDPSKPNTWLTYLDMNNLYGTSMSEVLPEKDFAWLTPEQIDQLDICNIDDNSEMGYILEIDLEYPTSLHDEHNCYPLAPENTCVTKDMLSPDSQNLRKKLNIKGKPSRKLVPNLCSKQQYVLHYRNLKYYLSKGMVLTKIHRVIEFTQSAWLKPYIDFNTAKRMVARNDFEKDFFKLMNNSVFGKTMENMRKRVSVELVNTPKRLRKVCAKPNFQSFKIFNQDLVAVNMKKTNIVFNRPIYAGFCILEVSKIFMYQFHYDFIKQKYGSKAELLFTDTDSLAYCIETHDWYKDMHDNADLFDTSNFPKDSPLYSMNNCKVLGKMKDECKGQIMDQFVGLKPKMYSLTCGGIEKRTAKGVKKSVIEKHLRHQAYLLCLSNQSSCKHKMNLIRSFDHQLYSITVNKTSLSPYDDKRYFTGIDSLAYGHFKIPQ